MLLDSDHYNILQFLISHPVKETKYQIQILNQSHGILGGRIEYRVTQNSPKTRFIDCMQDTCCKQICKSVCVSHVHAVHRFSASLNSDGKTFNRRNK